MPRPIRLSLRKWRARKVLDATPAIWPIRKSAGTKPAGWGGWPEDKQFAFVLTHDVESQKGLDQVREMIELELRHGFVSAVNFIPEGTYRVGSELREWLASEGFEIGVHDLNHDGRLYDSREDFSQKASRINDYLKAWGAVGFRSGFMLRQLEWLHDLNISYDASTFDTDPFEPQPDGAHTIFPFEISDGTGRSYVELPYTLPQDSTLFLVLGEDSADTWKRKLDWVAEHGGMALVNVHPDYLSFDGESNSQVYPSELFEEFLSYVKTNYAGRYWNPLPREVAELVKSRSSSSSANAVGSSGITPVPQKQKIWIDLENTPHIPFFNPIMRELKSRGYEVVVTARDAYQTCEMADLYGLEYEKIGHHYGKHKLMKIWGLLARSSQLLPFARREKPDISLNHGSRTQSVMSKILGIPTVSIMDYEHTSSLSFAKDHWMITPKLVSTDYERSRQYSGIKEDVYVPEFRPDSTLKDQLGLCDGKIVVTVRPPATEAHYHNPEADVLFTHFMDLAHTRPDVKCVLLPRNKRQETVIRKRHPEWFDGDQTVIPAGVVDGLNLLWHSDLVVSGGGTMNREAAALGIPVYSIFRGTAGAVDLHLQKEGRLVMIASKDEVDEKIELKIRSGKNAAPDSTPRQALIDIVSHLEEILAFHYPAAE